MIGGNAHPRRAEEFDTAIAGRASGPAQARYAELLDVVSALRAVPEPLARPEFVASLRSQLMTAAAQQPARRTDQATALRLTPRQRRGSRERRMAALLGGFAVVAASGSMAVASQSALPGDTLYPVKRAIENAHANLESSPGAKAAVLLSNADTRLSEVEQLSSRDNADSTEISATLQAFKDQTSQASAIAIDDFNSDGDSAALDSVHSFASTSMGRLDALDEVLPVGARPALVAAAQTVKTVDQAAYDACPTCTDGPVTQLPSFATLPLSAHLGSPLLGTTKNAGTIVTSTPIRPAGTHSSTTSTGAAGQPPAGNPTAAATGVPPSLPSTTPDIISGTVDQLTKDLLGSRAPSPSASTTKASTTKSNGAVVDTLAGLLGLH